MPAVRTTALAAGQLEGIFKGKWLRERERQGKMGKPVEILQTGKQASLVVAGDHRK